MASRNSDPHRSQRDRDDDHDERGWIDRARDWFRGDRSDESHDDRFGSRGRH